MRVRLRARSPGRASVDPEGARPGDTVLIMGAATQTSPTWLAPSSTPCGPSPRRRSPTSGTSLPAERSQPTATDAGRRSASTRELGSPSVTAPPSPARPGRPPTRYCEVRPDRLWCWPREWRVHGHLPSDQAGLDFFRGGLRVCPPTWPGRQPPAGPLDRVPRVIRTVSLQVNDPTPGRIFFSGGRSPAEIGPPRSRTVTSRRAAADGFGAGRASPSTLSRRLRGGVPILTLARRAAPPARRRRASPPRISPAAREAPALE